MAYLCLFTMAFATAIMLPNVVGVTCHCKGQHCNDSSGHCTVPGGACFYMIERVASGKVYDPTGCYSAEKLAEGPFFCRQGSNENLIIRCCKEDYCNVNTLTLPPPAQIPQATPQIGDYRIIIGIAIAGGIAFIILIIVIYLMIRKTRRHTYTEAILRSNNSLVKNGDENRSSKTSFDDCWSSGSGAGLPLLVPRSIARQIQLMEVIGKGRYGEVYRGKWRGDEDIAVKKFSSRDEQSWNREKHIYQTVMLRHENILGFIASDNKDGGTWTELWLISEYHENGSLFDYLGRTQIDEAGMFKLMISIVSGLGHLHMEIVGTQDKPPIAHRDLKSKNILVKKNGECAIADLGLAVKLEPGSDRIDMPSNDKAGTVRYMAPEVLDETINVRHFDSFKRADIYSLGLVFWEIARRTNIGGQDLPYELPYFDMAPNDPTVEDMKNVVCVKKLRPPAYPIWKTNDCLRGVYKIMQECWYEIGNARLTALRVKKDLNSVREEEEIKIV